MPTDKPKPTKEERIAAINAAPAAPEPEPAAAAPEPVLSAEDAAELAQYRAEKARRETLVAAAYGEDGRPNLDLDPKDPAFLSLTEDDQIRAHYLHARGTIQDYARLFNRSVPEVLNLIGQGDMAQVQTTGDLIGDDEISENDAPISATGRVAKVPFSLN